MYAFLKLVTKANSAAFISALLFTTHPLLTEAVNSVSYREDLLAAFFFLIAFIVFLKIDKESLPRGKFLPYYAGSLFSYLLSLFSKETAVTLPILLVVFNAFYSPSVNPLQAVMKRAKGVYTGYFIVTGFYLVIRFALFRHPRSKLCCKKKFSNVYVWEPLSLL
ncbi:MAG: hypothetical protein NG747_04710 [Candidatus Brocadia sp.]|nr:hypothetical protein [Candidatus Brocadia sp.]